MYMWKPRPKGFIHRESSFYEGWGGGLYPRLTALPSEDRAIALCLHHSGDFPETGARQKDAGIAAKASTRCCSNVHDDIFWTTLYPSTRIINRTEQSHFVFSFSSYFRGHIRARDYTFQVARPDNLERRPGSAEGWVLGETDCWLRGGGSMVGGGSPWGL